MSLFDINVLRCWGEPLSFNNQKKKRMFALEISEQNEDPDNNNRNSCVRFFFLSVFCVRKDGLTM